jgi:hypothetical protein
MRSQSAEVGRAARRPSEQAGCHAASFLAFRISAFRDLPARATEMHFAEVVIRGLYAVEVTLARNRQLVGLLNIGIALDVEQLVAGLPQQPGDGR